MIGYKFRPYFKRKGTGIDLLRAEQVTEARPYLWRAFANKNLIYEL